MSKLVVSANSKKHLEVLIKKNIDGVIVSIDGLSVNDSFYMDVDTIMDIDFGNKELFININKLMHNRDLEQVRIVLNKLKNKDVKILFYDMAVYNIAKEYNMIDKLVIYQDHLNASILSNKFYYDNGIHYSYITSDITKDELLEIKKDSNMKIMFLGYGYAPIFYSRRYLIRNYLKYIDKEFNGNDYNIVSDTGINYPINEEKYGTTIYSSEVINLVNKLDELKDIDYIVLRSNKIDDSVFNKMVDRFINHEKVDDVYLGFFDKKTIYKIK